MIRPNCVAYCVISLLADVISQVSHVFQYRELLIHAFGTRTVTEYRVGMLTYIGL